VSASNSNTAGNEMSLQLSADDGPIKDCILHGVMDLLQRSIEG
jgi:hypothetical protein